MDVPLQTLKALSDPTRLRILCLLRGGRLCVGDLVEVLGVPQPTASRHLAALRDAGRVEVERSGSWAFYSVSPPRTALDQAVVALLEASLAESPELTADLERARRLATTGGCCPEAARPGAPAAVEAR